VLVFLGSVAVGMGLWAGIWTRDWSPSRSTALMRVNAAYWVVVGVCCWVGACYGY
jgi:hypothetical protein